ncbi:MAG: gamma-glutamyltransferase [Bergeyella sp.]|nr:gamma-glutamyltransferase [Bergeyella sp.]
MIKYFFAGILLACSLCFNGQYRGYNTVKEVVIKDKGVVVSAHPLASEVGAKILKAGGNAFDAAIAIQYVLAVVYPQAGNIGGGGFLVGVKKNGEKLALDYREIAPRKATRDMYLDKNGKARTDWSQNGSLAAGIPGSVAGLFAMQKHGNFPMELLIEPAIDIAEKGFAITKREADLLNQERAGFVKYNRFPTAFVKNTQWKEGDLLIQKDLAETLRRIKKYGAKGFYEGKTASLIVEEMKKGKDVKGIISKEDLKSYKVRERIPITFSYKGHEIVTMPLPSSGGILLTQMLKMSSYENLEQYQQNSYPAVQIMTEAERRAYSDRAKYMGDPAFVEDKTSWLISDEHLKELWESYKKNQATPSSFFQESPKKKESAETTHVSVLDKEGNAVSVTTTLNGLYGSKVVVKDAGFFLNNEMDDFSIKPGVPNLYGAVGGEANAIAPGKEMLSSMTPTVILKDGKIFMVVGTPGGTTIPTSVYQTIVDVIDFKVPASITINAPKFHHQWLPDRIDYEEGFPKHTLKELEKTGYKTFKRDPIGRTELIIKDENKTITAVADGRGDDSVGVE